jgi:hypothetical protein
MNLGYVRNPFAQSPGCATCDDTRHVAARDYSATGCPVCGCTCSKRLKGEPPPELCSGCITSRNLKRDAFHRFAAPPTLLELDFSIDELAAYRQLRAAHPNASRLTVLGWIEGQRYEPAKDPDFIAACEAALDDWRRATGRETKREVA